jgi:hypothetical protein
LETQGRTIYFDQFRYTLNIEHVTEESEKESASAKQLLEPGVVR